MALNLIRKYVMINPTMSFPNRSDKNRAVQAQTLARGCRFWILNVEELYYPCSENKGARLSIFPA